MKPVFPTFMALLIAAASVSGQNSPAPMDAKASPAESKTLTSEERTRAIDYLKETQKDFLAATDGLSDAQWKFKAGPDRWSIAETAEHIAVTEGMIWGLVTNKIMKSPPAPEKRAEVKGKEEMIMKAIPDRSRKAQAPEPLRPTGRWATRAELAKEFEATRGQELAYIKDTQENLRDHFEEHPAVKTLDAYQWLLFNGAHCKRHTAQILEVKADPNFPKK